MLLCGVSNCVSSLLLLFLQPTAVASNANVLASAKQVTPTTANKKPQSDSEDSDSDSSSSDGNYSVFANF